MTLTLTRLINMVATRCGTMVLPSEYDLLRYMLDYVKQLVMQFRQTAGGTCSTRGGDEKCV